ncbi:MAG: AMP-binding protein, partial [Acidobacteriota bacterium]
MSAPGDRPTRAAATIDTLAADVERRQSTLSDARRRVTYAEVPALLDRIDEVLKRRGVDPSRSALALECSQSVAGALALLHALHRGHSVVLLPEPDEKVPRSIPSFCTHVITATEAPADAAGDAFPGSHLRVTAHEGHVAGSVVDGFAGPDIYLRTSGSTAASKLARMSHGKWLDNAAAAGERWGIRAAERIAIPVPIFHAYGLGAAFLPGMLAGASMDLVADFNILRYLEREKSFHPTVA